MMEGEEQQKGFLKKYLEKLDADGVKEKLDYMTWIYGWSSAIKILESAIAEQNKVSDVDIDKILSRIFEGTWSDTSEYSHVLKHISQCPDSNDFDDIVKWVKDSKRKFPQRPKTAVRKSSMYQLQKQDSRRKTRSSQQLAGLDEFLNATKLETQGRLDAAVSEIRKAIKIGGEIPAYLMLLGRLLPHQKKHAESIEILTKLVQLEPNDAMSWLRLGMELLIVENIVESEKAFKKVKVLERELLKEAEIVFRTVMTKFPNDPKWLFGCSVVSRLLGKKDESKKLLDMAIDKDIAYLFINCNKPVIAERYARIAVKRFPQNAELLFMLGLSLDRQEKYKLAEKYYRKALRIDSEFPFPWIGLSEVLLKQQKVTEGKEADRMAQRYLHRKEMYFLS